jgi:hypothetical protein
MTLRDHAGQIVILAEEPLYGGVGGEGAVFEVIGEPKLVAKVYHQKNRTDKAEKLAAMIAAPPGDVSSGLGHFSICWPLGVLFEPGGSCAGFLMPRVNTAKYHKLFCLYHLYDRQSAFPAFTWDNLLHAGRNLAFILSSLHSRGYVIGDVNESNFLVSEQALVTIVDCDSMQVRGTGRTFLCDVGKDEYIAPELYYDRSAIRRVDQDNFSLAILLFLMLMEGFSPFDGIGDESPPEELILNGNTPYVLPSKVTPKPNAPPFAMLPVGLQALFVRAFGQGHKNPAVRPTSEEFYRALAAVKVTRCKVERRHVYPDHNAKCPWCERAALLGIDTFAAAEPEPGAQPLSKQATQAVDPNTPLAVQPQAQPHPPLQTGVKVQSPPQAQPQAQGHPQQGYVQGAGQQSGVQQPIQFTVQPQQNLGRTGHTSQSTLWSRIPVMAFPVLMGVAIAAIYSAILFLGGKYGTAAFFARMTLQLAAWLSLVAGLKKRKQFWVAGSIVALALFALTPRIIYAAEGNLLVLACAGFLGARSFVLLFENWIRRMASVNRRRAVLVGSLLSAVPAVCAGGFTAGEIIFRYQAPVKAPAPIVNGATVQVTTCSALQRACSCTSSETFKEGDPVFVLLKSSGTPNTRVGLRLPGGGLQGIDLGKPWHGTSGNFCRSARLPVPPSGTTGQAHVFMEAPGQLRTDLSFTITASSTAMTGNQADISSTPKPSPYGDPAEPVPTVTKPNIEANPVDIHPGTAPPLVEQSVVAPALPDSTSLATKKDPSLSQPVTSVQRPPSASFPSKSATLPVATADLTAMLREWAGAIAANDVGRQFSYYASTVTLNGRPSVDTTMMRNAVQNYLRSGHRIEAFDAHVISVDVGASDDAEVKLSVTTKSGGKTAYGMRAFHLHRFANGWKITAEQDR